ncbi:MAG: glycosyltransferase family 4 protein [Flavobacteriaceae bacterium]|nr:glycosyltransferase family 4 protein [Flavobacteriaceae bacterium]
MKKKKLIRVTTVPLSLEKLLEGQLRFMSDHFDVTAISSEKERLERYGMTEGVRTYYVPMTRKITPFKDLWAVWSLFRFLRSERPEIVHTHTPKAGMVGMLAARLAGIPNRLHTVAGLPLMETKGFKRRILIWVEILTYRWATRVYPNSMGLYDFIVQSRLSSKTKLKFLGHGSSNGIDTSFFSKSHFSSESLLVKRAELGIPESDLVFLFVGRMVKDKGIDELIDAFKELQLEQPHISLLLVGPLEDELDPLSPHTGHIIETHPKIFMIGYQEDVRIYFAISDILSFPSYREGFPNVVMQAGAMGLPSVVTNINGCNEIISSGVNGLLIPPKDPIALKKALKQLILDAELRSKLSANARIMITERYERRQFWDLLLLEYQNLKP